MKKLLFLLCMTGLSLTAAAEELVLTVPELEPKLTYGEPMTYRPELSLDMANADAVANLEAVTTANAWKPDFDFFKSKTNPGVKPYKFMDDLTFVGVPLFVAGWAVKGDKAMFRVNQKAEMGGKKNTQLLSDFKTGIDDYSQFFGPAMVVGLKLGGYEGRSDWPRLLASAGMSYGIMAALVNGIKYTAKEMRPDGSTANSWPSGHTATAFVGASLLHKEYGLTRSPWWSVAGYGVATATGVMRVLNNRHWISDVMSGAGIGIMSTELGYALCDLMFKGKGLLRNDMDFNSENPSFFSISMGLGLGSKSIDFNAADNVDYQDYADLIDADAIKENIKFRAATVVDAEGAYFFNKYFGIGGRFRVRAMSAKTFGGYADNVFYEDIDAWDTMSELYQVADPNFDEFTFYDKVGYDFSSDDAFGRNAPVTNINGVVRSDHITEFTGSAGFYFNIPLSKHFSLGTKALIGRSITQDLEIDGHAEGNVKDIDYALVIKNGSALDEQGNLYPGSYINYPTNTGEKWTDEWDYLTLSAGNSTSWGTGLSLTYRYKSNFAWRIFCDYDYTKKDYTLTYDPYHFLRYGLTNSALTLLQIASGNTNVLRATEFKKTKKMNYFTLGMSFLVNL